MKKLLMITLSLVIIFTSLLYNQEGSNDTYANSNDKGEITASSLNVREKASTSSKVVGSLKKGNKVTIVTKTGDWYRISYYNVKGFVHSSYVNKLNSSEGSSSGGETQASTLGTGEITASNLNVRASASTSGKVISSLSRGTKVDLYAKSGQWYKVKVGSSYGFVHGSYVKKTTASSGGSSSGSGSNTPASQIESGEITASNLNVRASASTSGKVISSLSRGTKVDLYAKSGQWYKVKVGSSYGFVHSSYVKKTTASSGGSSSGSGNNTPASQIGSGEITVNNLNVRASASTSGKIISKLSRGTKVDLYEKSGSWFKIKVGNNDGFIHGSYVKTSTSASGSSGNGSLSGKTIFLDPGHGGNDPGAVAIGNIHEKTIALSVSNKLKYALEKEGAKVVTSRTNDTYISLSNRVNQANQSGADVFISLHGNSWHDSGPNGVEVLYNRSYAGDESARLAQVIQTRLANGLNLRNRGAREMSLQVIRSTRMPSVLVELGFMSNSSDLNKLRNNQDQYVNELVTALKEYY
ncbi:SH3 domain-containing protein [Salipaludibacillus sp. CF4.18]|uniref:SH3 domain-containing protein n=1 Tax=Salipaludibacillus sp. CF4.18 TaxID=3373081 RepID=UPI003EE6410E